MITLAIDGSTKNTGIAIFKQTELIHYECITATDSNPYKRIWKMVNKIKEIYNQYNPTDIIMEDVLPQDVKHNQKVYKALIYLQALIVLELYQQNNFVQVNFTTASHWRSLCGIKIGRGIKRENLKQASQNLIKKIYNIQVNDDISDAICIGMAYVQQNRSAF